LLPKHVGAVGLMHVGHQEESPQPHTMVMGGCLSIPQHLNQV
jgi:hypothetical protein